VTYCDSHPRNRFTVPSRSALRSAPSQNFNAVVNAALNTHICCMRDTERLSETVLGRNQRREAEINEALKQEADRHDAAVKNMHRLRTLRLQHDKKAKGT
jgi:hypothetical protein